MANKKSSVKRIRTNERNRQRNTAVRSRVKTYVGHALAAIESKDPEKTAQAVKAAVSEIDRAASKGVIHANTAARKKSTLQRRAASAE